MEAHMEYFECPPPKANGLCSDPECPCDEASIPRGEGYLCVTADCVDFRRDARSIAEASAKIEKIGEERNQLIIMGPGVASPILMCEQGARKRGLDLKVASADAKAYWETGKAPLRATPLEGRTFSCGHPQGVGERDCGICRPAPAPASAGSGCALVLTAAASAAAYFLLA
jgi:hypothetical protein